MYKKNPKLWAQVQRGGGGEGSVEIQPKAKVYYTCFLKPSLLIENVIIYHSLINIGAENRLINTEAGETNCPPFTLTKSWCKVFKI